MDRRERQAVMGLGDHLEEARKRMMWAVLGLAPIVAVMMVFGDAMMGLVLRPVLAALREAGLPPTVQATGVLETFMSWFKVALVAAVVVGGPWIIYQAWLFVAPGLYAGERRFIYVLSPLSVLLTVAGVSFMYFGMMPLALRFMVHFGEGIGEQRTAHVEVGPGVKLAEWPVLAGDPAVVSPGQGWINSEMGELRLCVGVTKDADGKTTATDVRRVVLERPSGIVPHYRLQEYVDLFFLLMLMFAVTFQVPVVMLLLGWVGIITPQTLARYRRYALGVSAVVAVLITGDPVSMLIAMVPLYALYELGMLLMKWLPASRVRGKMADGEGGEG